MLITTSRKPSNKTRSFCRYLNLIFDSKYINRGKMSFDDIRLKLFEFEYHYIFMVYEMHGNPSKITIFDENGEKLAYLTINVKLPDNKINIVYDDLTFSSEIKDLLFLEDIFTKKNETSFSTNHILIEKASDNYKATLRIIDNKSLNSGFKIFIKNYELK